MNQVLMGDLSTTLKSQDSGLAEVASESKPSEIPDESLVLPVLCVDRRQSPNRKSNRRFYIYWILVVPFLAVAAWFAIPHWTRWATIGDITSSAEQTRPSVAKVVTLGRLEPEGEVIDIAGPSGSGDARVQLLAVEIGDEVKAGQVLAELDNKEQLKTQRVVAEAQVEQARARLEQTRLIATTTYAQLHASLEALRLQREKAQSDLRRQEQLRRTNASSDQEYEAALLAFDTADRSVAEAAAKLARYSENPEESVDVQVAAADVRVAEASLINSVALLERALVRAPNDGRILSIGLRPGERMGQQSLLRMGKTDSMLVRAEVYESDIAKIQLGRPAKIYARAFAAPLPGTVERVATLVQRQSIVDSDPAANTDARVVEVLVRIANESTDQAARFVGMQVTVEFPL